MDNILNATWCISHICQRKESCGQTRRPQVQSDSSICCFRIRLLYRGVEISDGMALAEHATGGELDLHFLVLALQEATGKKTVETRERMTNVREFLSWISSQTDNFSCKLLISCYNTWLPFYRKVASNWHCAMVFPVLHHWLSVCRNVLRRGGIWHNDTNSSTCWKHQGLSPYYRPILHDCGITCPLTLATETTCFAGLIL